MTHETTTSDLLVKLGSSMNLLAPILAAAAVGGVAGGGLTARGEARPTETRTERRKRILRNATLGALGAGGAAAAGTGALQSFGSALSENDSGFVTPMADNNLVRLLSGGAGFLGAGRARMFNPLEQAGSHLASISNAPDYKTFSQNLKNTAPENIEKLLKANELPAGARLTTQQVAELGGTKGVGRQLLQHLFLTRPAKARLALGAGAALAPGVLTRLFSGD